MVSKPTIPYTPEQTATHLAYIRQRDLLISPNSDSHALVLRITSKWTPKRKLGNEARYPQKVSRALVIEKTVTSSLNGLNVGSS